MKLLQLSALALGISLSGQGLAIDLFSSPNQLATELQAELPKQIDNRLQLQINAPSIQFEPSLTIQLEANLKIQFDRKDAEVNQFGSTIWHGVVSGKEIMKEANEKSFALENNALLVNRDGNITGSVHYNGVLYKISPSGNGAHQVDRILHEQMPPDHDPDFYEQHAGNVYIPGSTTENNFLDTLQIAPAADTTIKVLVAYTAAAKSKSGDINSLIDLAISETNQGYSNTGITGNVELVHKYEISYTESSSSATDTNRLSGKSDGYMDGIHAVRDQYGADVVLLVEDVNGSCGRADAIMATAASAFAIVDYDCATGYYSTGHEIGHLQGARHDPAADPTTSPYSYGHGYRHPGADWRTVMAYNCSPSCTRINWWSDPDNRRSGDVMGTSSSSDNARVLDQTIPTLAAFRGGADTGGDSLTKANLSGNKDSWNDTTWSIPSGRSTLSVSISGGTGDSDLYVRQGSSPTLSTYDCRPYLSGNNETCTFNNPAAGTWYFSLYAYSTYSGVTLNASH